MDYEKTGRFLQELRKENGLTQLVLAERLGVTDRAVSKWERGKGFPDVSLLKTLAEVLGVSVGELLEGEKRTANREMCFPDGSAALSVSEADTVAMKGIRAYMHDARRKTTIWKSAFAAVLILLVLAVLLAAGYIWQYAHTPVDFQKDELDFQRICMVSGGTVVEEINLEGSLGEEFRSQVQGLLREILMERVEYRGFLLPKEYEEGIAVELEGLATFYPGVLSIMTTKVRSTIRFRILNLSIVSFPACVQISWKMRAINTRVLMNSPVTEGRLRWRVS